MAMLEMAKKYAIANEYNLPFQVSIDEFTSGALQDTRKIRF